MRTEIQGLFENLAILHKNHGDFCILQRIGADCGEIIHRKRAEKMREIDG